jgi:type VI secretion system protein ImpH
MVNEIRRDMGDLETQLLHNPGRYSLVQVYRVLCALVADAGGDPLHQIRLRPLLAMGLPRAEVHSIKKVQLADEQQVYWVDVNLAGLYGQQSVLPNFVTEEIVQAAFEDETGARFFLDMIHQRLYQLVYQARVANAPHASAERVASLQQLLLTMAGLKNAAWLATFSDTAFVLRNINIFRHQRGTNVGLTLLLSRLFEGATVNVEQCCERWVDLPGNQRLFIGQQGHQLGSNGILGKKMSEHQGKIQIKIGPVSPATYRSWVLDRRRWQGLTALVQYFIDQPLLVGMTFDIDDQAACQLPLGEAQALQLGRNAWLTGQPTVTSPLSAHLRLL